MSELYPVLSVHSMTVVDVPQVIANPSAQIHIAMV